MKYDYNSIQEYMTKVDGPLLQTTLGIRNEESCYNTNVQIHEYLKRCYALRRISKDLNQGYQIKMLFTSTSTLSNALETLDEDAILGAQLEIRKINKPALRRRFCESLINKLASRPLEFNIECAIANERPTHKDIQSKYIMKLKSLVCEAINIHNEGLYFPSLLGKHIAIDCAYINAISDTIQDNNIYYDISRNNLLGTYSELYKVFRNSVASGYREDLILSDKLAWVLGVRNWYKWAYLDEGGNKLYLE